MKSSWMWVLVGASLAVGGLAMSARAQSNIAYAVEFNTSNNRFGTINLMNGTFTEIASLGSTIYNDIAYAPDGTLYGLANNGSTLVTFDQNSGAITTVASLSAPGLESIAFRPGDGVLFGATGSGLLHHRPRHRLGDVSRGLWRPLQPQPRPEHPLRLRWQPLSEQYRQQHGPLSGQHRQWQRDLCRGNRGLREPDPRKRRSSIEFLPQTHMTWSHE